eukprot:TRINITY_DN13271_c0_g1_i2.p2 TRINITY_DN13271_c0_g1~~TRINITY_DN13271_c0_g1_i2.p2  ORF type:complete len:134 (+),score=9.69 TRINITY_DN13271_c0_g1_i2:117-518(+)
MMPGIAVGAETPNKQLNILREGVKRTEHMDRWKVTSHRPHALIQADKPWWPHAKGPDDVMSTRSSSTRSLASSRRSGPPGGGPPREVGNQVVWSSSASVPLLPTHQRAEVVRTGHSMLVSHPAFRGATTIARR